MKITLKEGWIAKDESGDIFWYKSKPTKTGLMWSSTDEMSSLELIVLRIPDLGLWYESLHRITEDGELIKEHPELKIDQKVIVWNDAKKYKRYFAGWTKEGKIMTFFAGKTSFSNGDNGTTAWAHYEIVD